YYREVRVPDAEDIKLIGVAAHLAVIAIDRTRREEELEIHRHHLTELVNQRTNELSTAKEKAEASNLALSVANLELASALHNLNVTHEELVRRDKLAAL
ncbi:histidine kinase, partial [Undibacterium sp. CCC3.4]|nr:histidine kinase [Undibacterium sp. CCC3.4]